MFIKVPGSVRVAPFQLLLDDSRAVTCIQCRDQMVLAETLDLILSLLIGAYRPTDRDVLCRGSGCIVPTGPDTRRVVKYRVHPSSHVDTCGDMTLRLRMCMLILWVHVESPPSFFNLKRLSIMPLHRRNTCSQPG